MTTGTAPLGAMATVIHDAMFPGAQREDPVTWPRQVSDICEALTAAGFVQLSEGQGGIDSPA